MTFTHSTAPAIPNDNINTIFLDGENAIWIGTDSGAVSYKGGWTTFVDSLQYPLYNPDRIAAVVTTICESKDGSIWFGTAADGVRRYNRFSSTGKTWIRYSINTDTDNDGNGDLANNTITSITAIRSGTPAYVFVSSVSGVNRFQPSTIRPGDGTWQSIDVPPLPDFDIEAMSINPATNLFCFGTKFSGAAFYDQPIDSWSYYRFPSRFNYPISTITFDPWSNTVWMGKWEGMTSYSLALSKDSSYTNANTSGNLPTGAVHAIAIQSTTSRWLGTDKGLVYMSGSSWSLYTQSTTPELPSNIITALQFDASGNLWIGTPQGIAVFNPKGTKL